MLRDAAVVSIHPASEDQHQKLQRWSVHRSEFRPVATDKMGRNRHFDECLSTRNRTCFGSAEFWHSTGRGPRSPRSRSGIRRTTAPQARRRAPRNGPRPEFESFLPRTPSPSTARRAALADVFIAFSPIGSGQRWPIRGDRYTRGAASIYPSTCERNQDRLFSQNGNMGSLSAYLEARPGPKSRSIRFDAERDHPGWSVASGSIGLVAEALRVRR